MELLIIEFELEINDRSLCGERDAAEVVQSTEAALEVARLYVYFIEVYFL